MCVCVCVRVYVLVRPQSPQTPFTELCEEGPLFSGAEGPEGSIQAFLSEISEDDVTALRQREEALLQIEVKTP